VKNCLIWSDSACSGYFAYNFKAIRSAKQLMIEYSRKYTENKFIIKKNDLGSTRFTTIQVILALGSLGPSSFGRRAWLEPSRVSLLSWPGDEGGGIKGWILVYRMSQR
jgi:hypothetical protein